MGTQSSFDLANMFFVFAKNLANMFLRERREGRKICKSRELPSELVIEILTRLPAKSLMRFKSVSKLWSSLICSRYFTDRCLKVSSSPLIYMRVDMLPFKNISLSSSSPLDDTTMLSFVVDQELTIPSMEGYSVSQVFRGLMCFINGQSAKIYNTTTRQVVALPDIEGSNITAKDKCFMYHIGHDPVHDQYKVLCTVSTRGEGRNRSRRMLASEHWVLLLGGGDGSSRWRKISSPCQPHLAFTQRLSINGRVYYLARVRGNRPHAVFSFNIRSEEICIVQEFEHNAFYPRFIALIEYGGRVALLHHYDFEAVGVMDLSFMDDADIWSRKSFVLDLSQMDLLNGISLRVQGTTRNGEVILVPTNTSRNPTTGKMIVQPQRTNRFHIFLYNLQNNHLREVEIKDTFNRYLTSIWDVIGLDDVENLMYL
ncbi:F-box/kelch-repeat protein [Raphanus sativus]|uniref:F-box protein At4g19940-like n=1 Tax=Raphanus sativus TaxID=3726 RepID=A0A6J0N721_RAPSA|nr:F-box protein At4g19940-like [Raphanus sativus]KAJ4903714.1 F-box/kelch-repeat protein [Raphanus sativus]